MPLPIQKNRRCILLNLSSALYPEPHIEKTLQIFAFSPKRAKVIRNNKIQIKFKRNSLKDVLEISNHLLSLNR